MQLWKKSSGCLFNFQVFVCIEGDVYSRDACYFSLRVTSFTTLQNFNKTSLYQMCGIIKCIWMRSFLEGKDEGEYLFDGEHSFER